MIHEIRLPEVGENVESGDVARVLVSVGERVKKEQPLIELETDKAVIEVPSPVEGVIKEILVKDGETIKVGQLIVLIDSEAEAAAPVAEEKVPPREEPAQERKIPEEESVPTEIATRPEEIVSVSEPQPAPAASVSAPPPPSEKPVPASPSVRRFARELGVDIRQVPGSGPGGRISVEDVKEFVKRRMQEGAVTGVSAKPLPDFTRWGEIERRPMSKVRQTTAEHLSYAWATVPHVTQFDRADVTELEKWRKRMASGVEAEGGKLTITAILLKICALALRKFPQFNASVDMERKEIIYKRYVHIGVAVDTDRGLLVPVLRDVDRKGLKEIAVELTELSRKARDGKLSLEEMQGGNFSISNLGGLGGTYFTPVVNWPEVAILGVSRAEWVPRFENGNVVPRLMLPLSLSYDHRLIDGADAVRFLRWIVEALENPLLLLMEGA